MKILNKKTDIIPSNSLYVGRPNKYGNPYKIGKDGTREEVILKYKKYLWNKLQNKDWKNQFIKDIANTEYLVCWCSPMACHASIIIKAYEWLIKQ